VVLQDTASVEGDIFHRTLTIDEGAGFEGQSRRWQEALDHEKATALAVELPQAKVAEGKRTNGTANQAGAEPRHA